MGILRDPLDFVGRKVYTKLGGINRILRFITGKTLSEYATVVMLKIICNFMYVMTVLAGFYFLPKNIMLLIAVLTSLIGPLIALLVIVIILGLFAFFVYAPCTSMNIICLGIFLSGPMGQSILKALGLDSDNDGDVDFIDLVRGSLTLSLPPSLSLSLSPPPSLPPARPPSLLPPFLSLSLSLSLSRARSVSVCVCVCVCVCMHAPIETMLSAAQ
jgi:hypothetical protein